MISYALSTLEPDRLGKNSDIFYVDENTGKNYLGFLRTRKDSVIRELEKYGHIKSEILNKLTEILDNHNLNVRMLVAADFFYRGNDYPEKLTPELFSMNNINLLKISSISFGENKVWDKDSLSTLLTYCKFLKDNLYSISETTYVAEETSDNEDEYGYDDDEED